MATNAVKKSNGNFGFSSPKKKHDESKNKPTKAADFVSSSSPARKPGDNMIQEVWAHNLKEEVAKIQEIIDEHNYIAMDTEFPGVVARPIGTFKTTHDYHYQTLKCNVDLLKIIQLGLSFCDQDGNLLPGTCTWQFNFKFNLSEDMYAQDSIDLLAKSGIDFKEHDSKGIDVHDFGEVLMTSGIVLNENVKWISFHSGYDYGYLLKVLTCQALPKEETEFFELLRLYFPCVYDIKYLMKSCENLKGGLQKVAERLQVERIGPQHQAGSDSLLTAATFFKMKSVFFENKIDDEKYMGVLFGLGTRNGKKRLERAENERA
jgi:CCR4-NOT transcription complex subunit 7/8